MGGNVSPSGSWFVASSVHPLFVSQLSPSTDSLIAVFLTFTCVTSVLGNGTSLLMFCRRRKKLRPPELMIVNLALCDLGFSLLGAPFFIISSWSHAWVFGDTGCLLYGIQGFLFGIGSLLTTCLISLDRCLKICCLRYGQWIERRHVLLSLALLWVYTSFWAVLPAFGFGSYGPEPYGTSCSINWWRIKTSLNDRIYIFLIMMLCFGFPALIIVASYVIILRKVYRSSRTLASIPSASVSHSGKDLRVFQMAAVVCASFFIAWMPYTTISLISALIPSEDQEASLHSVVEESSSANPPKTLDIPSLLNWTATEYYRHIYYNPESRWSGVEMNSASIASPSEPSRPRSAFSPLVSLIPAVLAKSHTMLNPLIYHIMNREFRYDMYAMMFGQVKAEKRKMSTNLERHSRNLSKQKRRESKSKGRFNSWADTTSSVGGGGHTEL
nr:opsin 9 [Pseudochaenichthys georgianus]